MENNAEIRARLNAQEKKHLKMPVKITI